MRWVFTLPDLGEGLTESEIVDWKVAEGDTVGLDQILAEVETAKALVELPSPRAGVIERLHAAAGATVPVGSPLVSFVVEDEASPQPDAPHAHPRPGRLHSPAGDAAGTDERNRHSGEDDAGGDVADAPPPNLVGYGAAAERSGHPVRRPRRFPAAQDPEPSLSVEPPAGTPPQRARARAALPPPEGTAPTPPAPGAGPPPSLPSRTAVEIERIPVTGVRRATAQAMVASAAVPQVTVWLSVDVTATLELLERQRGLDGHAPTLLAAVARAVCLALRRAPEINSRWIDGGGVPEILRFRDLHLGVAVAAPRGLLVPVLRDAQSQDLAGLAAGIRELAQTARAGRCTPAQLTGGTFTITNIGVFGVDGGTPLLHDGQAAILAVGTAARRPWEHRGAVALRSVVTLSLTVDHRVLDGEAAARFLAECGTLLADPASAFTR